MTGAEDHGAAQPRVVGIDLGGTNIRATLFEGNEAIRTERRSSQLDPERGEEPVATVLALLDALSDGERASVRAVGLAITGPVDRASGLVGNPFTLPAWSGAPWVERLRDELGVPVVVENDAMGAALGEFHRGAGAGADTMCMVTLGTGVGVALVSADRGPLRGSGGSHPEAGHLLIGGEPGICYCGENGCWEEWCSGRGVRRHWTGEDGMVDWEAYGAKLARGIRMLCRVYGPDRVVVGGGIAANFADFAGALERALATPDPMGPAEAPRIVRAQLADPGGHGAAHLALAAIDPRPHPPERRNEP